MPAPLAFACPMFFCSGSALRHSTTNTVRWYANGGLPKTKSIWSCLYAHRVGSLGRKCLVEGARVRVSRSPPIMRACIRLTRPFVPWRPQTKRQARQQGRRHPSPTRRAAAASLAEVRARARPRRGSRLVARHPLHRRRRAPCPQAALARAPRLRSSGHSRLTTGPCRRPRPATTRRAKRIRRLRSSAARRHQPTRRPRPRPRRWNARTRPPT